MVQLTYLDLETKVKVILL